MPDDPHVPETGFILAAEKAIKNLQDTAEAQRLELDKQQALLTRAESDARWRKIQVRILGIVSVLLIVVCVLGTVQYFHTREIARKVQQGSITQCLDSNHVRADDIKIWDTFVALLEGPHPTVPVAAEAKSFEGFIAKVYAPKDCNALFSISTPEPEPTSADAG